MKCLSVLSVTLPATPWPASSVTRRRRTGRERYSSASIVARNVWPAVSWRSICVVTLGDSSNSDWESISDSENSTECRKSEFVIPDSNEQENTLEVRSVDVPQQEQTDPLFIENIETEENRQNPEFISNLKSLIWQKFNNSANTSKGKRTKRSVSEGEDDKPNDEQELQPNVKKGKTDEVSPEDFLEIKMTIADSLI